MRAFASMRFLALLLLFGAATSSIFASNTREDTNTIRTPASPRNWPVVFGFEFTMDGIVTSAGLPNGSTIPIGVTKGSVAYRTEMARLYSICEETARTSNLPAVAQQYRSMGAPFRWRGNSHHWIGGPVTELRDVIVEAKSAALHRLSRNHGLEINSSITFHALATAPSFVFTALKPYRAKIPTILWEMRDFDPEVYPSLDAHLQAKAWLSIMVEQFSQAVVEAGFYRCTIPYVWETQPEFYPQNYDDFQLVHPAATHAVCAADVGSCSLQHGNRDSFHEQGLTPCSYPQRVAIVADLQNNGLSLWAEGLDGCQLDSVRWNTWSELKPPSRDNVTAWAQAVRRKITKLLEDTASKSNAADGIKLIPTGNRWTPELVEGLEKTSVALTIHEMPLPEFAASMNAAKVARYEEWSSHDFRGAGDEDSSFGRQAGDNVAWFDSPGWTHIKDKLWPVGGGCSNDQDCECACKWRGAPVCHPTDHACLCAELWEDIPGASREELYRGIWEADRKASQTVTRELLGEAQEICPVRIGPPRSGGKCRKDEGCIFNLGIDCMLY